MDFAVVGFFPPRVLEAARLEAAAHATLEDVVRWGLSQTPPQLVADVVVQDEYTHDVVLPLPRRRTRGGFRLRRHVTGWGDGGRHLGPPTDGR